jgi:hypothetical protein
MMDDFGFQEMRCYRRAEFLFAVMRQNNVFQQNDFFTILIDVQRETGFGDFFIDKDDVSDQVPFQGILCRHTTTQLNRFSDVMENNATVQQRLID